MMVERVPVAILEDFEEVATLLILDRREPPVIEVVRSRSARDLREHVGLGENLRIARLEEEPIGRGPEHEHTVLHELVPVDVRFDGVAADDALPAERADQTEHRRPEYMMSAVVDSTHGK